MTNINCNFRNSSLNINCAPCNSQQIQTEETQEHIFMCARCNKNNNQEKNREMFQNILNEEIQKFMKASVKHFIRNMKGKVEFEKKEIENQMK